MKNTSQFRIGILFKAIAGMMRKPLLDDKGYNEKLNNYRRELHFAVGENPIFIPKRKKLKGYQKKSQLSTFNKNR